MSQDYKYFVIPFDNVQDPPTYTVWYASWSKERPKVVRGMPVPVAIGVTKDDKLPPEAILIANSTKEPPPPPPVMAASTASEYIAAFNMWAELTKEG
jgi:hypothetical protein